MRFQYQQQFIMHAHFANEANRCKVSSTRQLRSPEKSLERGVGSDRKSVDHSLKSSKSQQKHRHSGFLESRTQHRSKRRPLIPPTSAASTYYKNTPPVVKKSNPKRSQDPKLNDLHCLLQQVTEKYTLNETKQRTNTSINPKQKDVLKGQFDYEMIRSRVNQEGNRTGRTLVPSGQRPIKREASGSTYNPLQHNVTSDQLQRFSRQKTQMPETGVLRMFASRQQMESRGSSKPKSQDKQSPYRTKQQFSLSTNFTFQSKPLQLCDFIILNEISMGRTGKVFRCIHTATFAIYALKVINKSLIKSLGQDRFLTELKIHLFLRHPNVVNMYGFFSDKKSVYLILQYCEGGSLYDSIKDSKVAPEKTVAKWVNDITRGLVYLHDLEVAHRDIKPENVVVNFGVSKICDFGCAVHCIERRSTNCGTLDYMAPQIHKREAYGIDVDVWGMGVMTYELLTGRAPFYHCSKQTTIQKILTEQLVLPSNMSPEAQSFVRMLLAKNPRERGSSQVMLHHGFLSKHCSERNPFV